MEWLYSKVIYKEENSREMLKYRTLVFEVHFLRDFISIHMPIASGSKEEHKNNIISMNHLKKML